MGASLMLFNMQPNVPWISLNECSKTLRNTSSRPAYCCGQSMPAHAARAHTLQCNPYLHKTAGCKSLCYEQIGGYVAAPLCIIQGPAFLLTHCPSPIFYVLWVFLFFLFGGPRATTRNNALPRCGQTNHGGARQGVQAFPLVVPPRAPKPGKEVKHTHTLSPSAHLGAVRSPQVKGEWR